MSTQLDFGILTLATDDDCMKAVGLVHTLRKTNPHLPIAIACKPSVAKRVGEHFDYCIDENPDLRGFRHKLFLDQYSPFRRTLFLDADILVFKDLESAIAEWQGAPYAARGMFATVGKSAFGLDRQIVLSKIGKSELVSIGGAGHAYFEKPQCKEVFDLARDIMENYTTYANPCKFADEDVMAIAMTILDLPPMPNRDFHARCWHALQGTMALDAVKGKCEFIDRNTGETRSPVLLHFACMEAPFLYHWNLEKLRRDAGIAPSQLWWRPALREYIKTDVVWRSKGIVKRLLSKFHNSKTD